MGKLHEEHSDLSTKHYWRNYIKKYELGGTFSSHADERVCIYNITAGNSQMKDRSLGRTSLRYWDSNRVYLTTNGVL
jgi:hypothetical protein